MNETKETEDVGMKCINKKCHDSWLNGGCSEDLGSEECQDFIPENGVSDNSQSTGSPLPDPADSFAQVELYWWQHGELPEHRNEKPLDVSAGLEGMSNAIKTGDLENFPSPSSIIIALEYAAKLLRKFNASNAPSLDKTLMEENYGVEESI